MSSTTSRRPTSSTNRGARNLSQSKIVVDPYHEIPISRASEKLSRPLSAGPLLAPPERHFNETSYNPEDDVFWKRYDELWGAAADAVEGDDQTGQRNVSWRQKIVTRNRSVAMRKLKSATRKPKADAIRLSKNGRKTSSPTDAAIPADIPHLTKITSRSEKPGPSKWLSRPLRLAGENQKTQGKQMWRGSFLGQLGHLKRSCSAEDFPRAKAAFWKWKKGLAETWQMFEESKLPRMSSENQQLRLLLESALKEEDKGVESMKIAWRTVLSSEDRQKTWPDLMIAALQACPDQAHTVFLATFDSPLIPSYLAEDTMHYLARQHQSAFSASSPSSPSRGNPLIPAQELYTLLTIVLDNSPENYLRLQQVTIYFFMRMLQTPDKVSHLYDKLVARKHPLHLHTRLQFAHHLVSSPVFKMQAVEILQATLSATGLDINTPLGAALCTNILSVREADVQATPRSSSLQAPTPAEMFELLLRCGLEPNLITYTAIIRGLCLTGELHAAQQVLQLMVERQSEPDDYVYSTIMNGAKLCRHFPILQQVAQVATARGIRHPFVWNDFLQAIYSTAFAEARRDPATAKRPRAVPAFPLMVQAYSKLFHLAPLRTILPEVGRRAGRRLAAQRGNNELAAASPDGGAEEAEQSGQAQFWLGISESGPSDAMNKRWKFAAQLSPTVQDLPQLGPEELIEPTGSTLVTMVVGYIQALTNPYQVITFYSHFRRLLEAGDPVALGLVREQGTRVHDIVVMALCEFGGMLRVALDVVGDMLRDAIGPEKASKQHQHEDQHRDQSFDQLHAAVRHPPPSVYTWSILLNGFMFHRQAKQGERILRLMRERGVEPSQVTWNTLMAGYARMQKVGKTAGSLQRLERAGYEPDDFTFRAFSYLHDKAAVLRYMEEWKRPGLAARAVPLGPKREAGQDNRTMYVRTSQTPYDGQGSEAGHHEPGHISTATATTTTTRGDSESQMGRGVRMRNRRRSANELRTLRDEVAEMAEMMDEEQRDSVARAPSGKKDIWATML